MTREEKCILAIKNGFKYYKDTGYVITPTGCLASKIAKNGYNLLTVRDDDKNTYYLMAHHFAWYFTFKECPNMLDHVNRDKQDNRIVNLRRCTNQLNALNNSGRGSVFCNRSGRYESRITINNKSIYLGKYDNEIDAHNAYLEYKRKIINELSI